MNCDRLTIDQGLRDDRNINQNPFPNPVFPLKHFPQNDSPKETAAQVSHKKKTFKINFQLTIKSKQIDLLVYLKINKTSKLAEKIWIFIVKNFLFIETCKSFVSELQKTADNFPGRCASTTQGSSNFTSEISQVCLMF